MSSGKVLSVWNLTRLIQDSLRRRKNRQEMLRPRAADVEVGSGEVRDRIGFSNVNHDDGVGFQTFEGSDAGIENPVSLLPAVEVWGCYDILPVAVHRAWPPCVRFGQFAVAMWKCIPGKELSDESDVLTLWNVEQPEAGNSA